MRREGFELTVSSPRVLFKKDDNGNKLEPFEEITVDLDEEYSSKIDRKYREKKNRTAAG